MSIRRDPVSGDVILSPLNRSFEDWLRLRDVDGLLSAPCDAIVIHAGIRDAA